MANTLGTDAITAYDLSLVGAVAMTVKRSALPKLAGLSKDLLIEVDSTPTFLHADVVPWGVGHIQAPTVHATNTGTGIKVAVADGGIDCSHPDLSGRVVGGCDFQSGNSTYCHSGSTTGVTHGTAVAGVIAASINNSGLVGVSPSVQVYNLRICNSGGQCSASNLASAITWAVNNGIKVFSSSVGDCGGSLNSLEQQVINTAYNAGLTMVFSAGNGQFSPNCTASDPPSRWVTGPTASKVLGVSAFGASLTYIVGYQYGAGIDISAPTNVQTTLSGGGILANFSGTSAAAPHVAGVAALLNVAIPAAIGYVTPLKIQQYLTGSAIDAGAPGPDNFYGAGQLNAYRAVNFFEVGITGPSQITGGNQSWTAASGGGGSPPFSYAWARRDFCSQTWYPVGTNSPTYTETTFVGQQAFFVRATLTSTATGMSNFGVKLVGGFTTC